MINRILTSGGVSRVEHDDSKSRTFLDTLPDVFFALQAFPSKRYIVPDSTKTYVNFNGSKSATLLLSSTTAPGVL